MASADSGLVNKVRSLLKINGRAAARADFDDFVIRCNPKNRHQRTETERFHRFTHEDLLRRADLAAGQRTNGRD